MEDFQQQLATWGPDANYAPPTIADAERYTKKLALSHYENFPVVSFFLPKELQQHFFNVYAYCRWADDLGDETGDPQLSLTLLDWWERELAACYRDTPQHPVFVALKPTIDAFQIPKEPFCDLLSAFRQDQTIRSYETFDELRDYCRRSADPVGRLVLYLCGQHRPETVVLSDSICTGLQLANFWQDVARDAKIGRCYLPREDRVRFGYSDADLTGKVTNPAFLELLQFEVTRARVFLQQGLPLRRVLPKSIRMDIDLFAQGGLKILEKIEALGYRVWEQRPKVTKWDMLKLFAKCWWRRNERR
ncbi:MAG: crtB 1 [Planctomycetaceae bacterium]|nr:crtB 1 [Planctomycetaceae bacterium]